MNARAQILLASASGLARPKAALTLLPEPDIEPDLLPVALGVWTLAAAVQLTKNAETLPDEPERDRFMEALSVIAARIYDDAFLALIDVLRRSRYCADEASRKSWVALFTILGLEHPDTLRHRRTLDMWLYQKGNWDERAPIAVASSLSCAWYAFGQGFPIAVACRFQLLRPR